MVKSSRSWVCVLSVATGLGIVVQWILVWTRAFPVTESVPGFRNYFLSFVTPDLWLVVAALTTGVLILRKDQRALLFGVALGSAMVFFGLYALTYDFNTGLLFNLSAGELFGTFVTLYNLLAGVLIMVLSWRGKDAPGRSTERSTPTGRPLK
jgi:hypothetical protein